MGAIDLMIASKLNQLLVPAAKRTAESATKSGLALIAKETHLQPAKMARDVVDLSKGLPRDWEAKMPKIDVIQVAKDLRALNNSEWGGNLAHNQERLVKAATADAISAVESKSGLPAGSLTNVYKNTFYIELKTQADMAKAFRQIRSWNQI